MQWFIDSFKVRLQGRIVIEKISPVKNPLSIIAIFAGIAEISGAVVLPFIETAHQAIYVWFLIVFPIVLVVLFFLTLNFNHKVLYAPSDYQNEENFLRSLPKATFKEKIQKIEAEIKEEKTTAQEFPNSDKNSASNKFEPESLDSDSTITYPLLSRQSTTTKYLGAEDLVFRKLSKEFSSQIQREVKPNALAGGYVFDGIVRDMGVTTVIEVKYIRNALAYRVQLRDTLLRIRQNVMLLPVEQAINFRALIAVVTDESSESLLRLVEEIERLRYEFSFHIEVRFYTLVDLEKEFRGRA